MAMEPRPVLARLAAIKVATRPDLAARWHDLMDVDAGRIGEGLATIEEVGWESIHLFLEEASGCQQTWSDRWGLHTTLAVFNPGAGDLNTAP
jgi:galactarate dehydratase